MLLVQSYKKKYDSQKMMGSIQNQPRNRRGYMETLIRRRESPKLFQLEGCFFFCIRHKRTQGSLSTVPPCLRFGGTSVLIDRLSFPFPCQRPWPGEILLWTPDKDRKHLWLVPKEARTLSCGNPHSSCAQGQPSRTSGKMGESACLWTSPGPLLYLPMPSLFQIFPKELIQGFPWAPPSN